MADESVGPGEGPFNRPESIAAIYAQDAAFWSLHERWRKAEDDFESGPYAGDEPEGELLYHRSSNLRAAMFLQEISTATALAAKLEVIAEAGAQGTVAMELPGPYQGGISIFGALQRDCQRLADLEAGQSAPDSSAPSV